MKIITNPEVYLIGKQTVVDKELDRFLDDHGITWESDSDNAGEVIAETAGRLCYMSFKTPRPGGNKAYLGHIIESQHGSVLSHVVFNFLITGVSRSLTHELIRHATGTATSQLSQRYVDESVAEYVAPPDLQKQIDEGYGEWMSRWFAPDFGIDEYLILKDYHRQKEISDDAWAGIEWLFAVGVAHRAYGVLSNHLSAKLEPELAKRYRLDPDLNKDDADLRSSELALIAQNKTELRKSARQAARSVLPNATETKLEFTMNVRAIRHVIEQRASRFADPEIRKLAQAIYNIVVAEAPNMFSDYVKVQLPDGTYELTTPYRKV